MKTMKNFSRIFSLLFVFALFTGCSKEQMIVGKWFWTSQTYYINNVQQGSVNNNVGLAKQNDNYTFIFNEDKTGARKVNQVYNFTYEIENNELILNYGNSNSVETFIILDLSADTLVLKESYNNNNNYYSVLKLVK